MLPYIFIRFNFTNFNQRNGETFTIRIYLKNEKMQIKQNFKRNACFAIFLVGKI